jgi:hypothetical protein
MKITNLAFTNKHSQNNWFTEQWVSGRFFDFITAGYQKIREPFLTYNHHFPGIKFIKKKTQKKYQKHAQPETHCSLPIPPKKLEPAVLWFLDFQNTKFMGVFKYPQLLHNGLLRINYYMVWSCLEPRFVEIKHKKVQTHLVVMAQVDNNIS